MVYKFRRPVFHFDPVFTALDPLEVLSITALTFGLLVMTFPLSVDFLPLCFLSSSLWAISAFLFSAKSAFLFAILASICWFLSENFANVSFFFSSLWAFSAECFLDKSAFLCSVLFSLWAFSSDNSAFLCSVLTARWASFSFFFCNHASWAGRFGLSTLFPTFGLLFLTWTARVGALSVLDLALEWARPEPALTLHHDTFKGQWSQNMTYKNLRFSGFTSTNNR